MSDGLLEVPSFQKYCICLRVRECFGSVFDAANKGRTG